MWIICLCSPAQWALSSKVDVMISANPDNNPLSWPWLLYSLTCLGTCPESCRCPVTEPGSELGLSSSHFSPLYSTTLQIHYKKVQWSGFLCCGIRRDPEDKFCGSEATESTLFNLVGKVHSSKWSLNLNFLGAMAISSTRFICLKKLLCPGIGAKNKMLSRRMLNSSWHLDFPHGKRTHSTEGRGELVLSERISVSKWPNSGKGVMKKASMPSVGLLDRVSKLLLQIQGGTDV